MPYILDVICRITITRFPEYGDVAIGSPDYYSYITGGLRVFMDDQLGRTN